MESSFAFHLLLQIALIALNAVFACIEIAFISTNEHRLERLSRGGNRKAGRLLKLSRQPARFLATIQVAITLSGFLGSAFAADHFSDGLADWLSACGVPLSVQTLDAVSVILITLALSYVTLVFGELVPKRLAMQHAERLALAFSGLVWSVDRLFAPLVWLLTRSTNGVLRCLGVDPEADPETVGEEDIRMLVDAGNAKGTIDAQEKRFIQNVFEFDDLSLGEILTHRTEVAALSLDDSDEAWSRIIHTTRHSRYPVCDGCLDRVTGVLTAKDWFRLEDRSRANVLAKAVRPAVFVSEHQKADSLFRSMKLSRNPFAVVCDEYGGVQGIITMNDLLERLVGDLGDEDEASRGPESPEIESLGGGLWRIRGTARVDAVSEALGVELPGEGADTFGGLLMGRLGEIPEDGSRAELTVGGLRVRIDAVRSRRIESAEVRVSEPEGEPAA